VLTAQDCYVLLSALAETLNVDIDKLPVVGSAPELVNRKSSCNRLLFCSLWSTCASMANASYIWCSKGNRDID